MADIARAAGVSTMTVSGVFRSDSKSYCVAEKTRLKVLAAARELGFRPNAMARATRSRKFRNIGFLVMKEPDYLYLMPRSFAGIYDVLNENAYHLTLIGLPPGHDVEKDRLPTSFQEEFIDAVIVDCGVVSSRQVQEVLPDAPFPVVWLNHKAKKNAVWFDDRAAAVEAVRSIAQLGYKRPAFIAYPLGIREWHESMHTRLAAFRKTTAALGLEAREIIVPDRAPAGHAFVEAALRDGPLPDVLFCYSDYDAVFIQRVLYRMGLRVPEDIGLIAFAVDSLPLSLVELSHVAMPWYEMGKRAAQMAIALGSDEAVELPSSKFNGTIVPGASTRSLSPVN